jgi:hypothetical protein
MKGNPSLSSIPHLEIIGQNQFVSILMHIAWKNHDIETSAKVHKKEESGEYNLLIIKCSIPLKGFL